MSPTASSRWCPTPEQLMILEEMYRTGIRTPNANLIKQITAHLSHYGKIEGKNVFYWFQNHKARDRQKLRRKLSKLQQEQMFHYNHHQQEWNLQNQHFVYNFGSPVSALQQVPYYHDPPSFLHQVGALGAVSHGNSYAWNSLDIPQQVGIHDPCMRMYNHDHENTRMITMDHHVGFSPPPGYCCPRPLKTLELFPVKSTNLKEDSSHISCSGSRPSAN